MGTIEKWKPKKFFPLLSRSWRSAKWATFPSLSLPSCLRQQLLGDKWHWLKVRHQFCPLRLRTDCGRFWSMVSAALVALLGQGSEVVPRLPSISHTRREPLTVLRRKHRRTSPKAWKLRKVPLLLGLFCLVSSVAASGCRIGEMQCRDGTCHSPDKYCDENFDCPNKEDEPQQCTRK